MSLSFKQALERLNKFSNYEKETPRGTAGFGLEPIKMLLAKLKDPCHHTPIIHIAGTKGKGSTAWFCGSLLHSTGIKVGLYSSPHLISVCERISINGVPISEGAFASVTEKVLAAAEEMVKEKNIKPTWFDLITAVAMQHFENQEAIVVVLETGLGGRLDSTNFCRPVVSVISKIGFDHMSVLGDTLSAIAMEKGGIIKKNIPVVSASQEEEVSQVLRKLSELNDANLSVLGEDIRVVYEGQGVDIDTGSEYYTALVKKAIGHHQWENAALAVTAVEILAKKIGLKFGEQDVRFALSSVEIPGRMQHWGDLFLDGAHNPLSMRVLSQTLMDLEYKDIRLIIGMTRDKMIEESLKTISSFPAFIWCVPLPSARSEKASCLAEVAARLCPRAEVRTCDSFKEALRQAREIKDCQDPIVVTGSLYLVGEALKEPLKASSSQSQ
jgi:dihydrofolate synthase/folylpolyglutamate synthase